MDRKQEVVKAIYFGTRVKKNLVKIPTKYLKKTITMKKVILKLKDSKDKNPWWYY